MANTTPNLPIFVLVHSMINKQNQMVNVKMIKNTLEGGGMRKYKIVSLEESNVKFLHNIYFHSRVIHFSSDILICYTKLIKIQ